ncbi:isopropylmalate/homocitrate/citramalate synthase [bacterium]|nr:MAG: isopropylmalate/homocitrate/citramalate synthase [bacterium]
MTTEQAIQAYFDAFNRKDVEALLALLDDHVVHDINEGPTETGRDAFRAFKTEIDRAFDEKIEDLVIMTNGDRGCAEFVVDGIYSGTVEGLPEATGQEYRIPACAIFEVREGLIKRVTSYYNLRAWTDAIEGAALSA